MKRIILLISALFIVNVAFCQVGIGTSTPHSSSILDLTATNKALLLPRIANTTAITAPLEGMIVYHESLKCFKGYTNGAWYNITPCASNPSALTVSDPTYQGTSVINTTGIGYNGEMVPAASTITVSVTATEPTAYNLTATHPITGLTYSASGEVDEAGIISVILRHNNAAIPATFYGTMTMPLIGASNALNLTPRIDIKSLPATATTVAEVTYGTQTWMDRNLGAQQAATATNDPLSFGSYYQWGRPSDGHEIVVRNGDTPMTGRGLYDPTAPEALSATDIPGHNNMILTSVAPFDWRVDFPNNRWITATQGPCPSGFRVPTEGEMTILAAFNPGTGNIVGNASASSSPLKLPISGFRSRVNGNFSAQGSNGHYWTTTLGVQQASPLINNSESRVLLITPTNVSISNFSRAAALPVRCIKDQATDSSVTAVNFTYATPVYNGPSVINSTGVAYNGETVSPSATINLEVEVTALGITNNNWSLSVSDPSGLAYSGSGVFTTTGIQTITLVPNTTTVLSQTDYGIKNMYLVGSPFTNAKTISPRIDIKSLPVSATAVVDVTYGTQVWMDRNLGAHRVATATNDPLSFGNYYQWGRPADGHEIIVRRGDTPLTTANIRGLNGLTAVGDLSTTDTPTHGDFIPTNTTPNDWRSDNNNNRWVTVTQGPCPSGYRVPSSTEFTIAFTYNPGTGNITNTTSGFNSPLKLPLGGSRVPGGALNDQGTFGIFWTRSVYLTNGVRALLTGSAATSNTSTVVARSTGNPVRCIKN